MTFFRPLEARNRLATGELPVLVAENAGWDSFLSVLQSSFSFISVSFWRFRGTRRHSDRYNQLLFFFSTFISFGAICKPYVKRGEILVNWLERSKRSGVRCQPLILWHVSATRRLATNKKMGRKRICDLMRYSDYESWITDDCLTVLTTTIKTVYRLLKFYRSQRCQIS